MVPPPKPLALSDETVVWDTAYEPRDASMLCTVGAGPRSYGLLWAPAPGAETVAAPAARPTVSARAASRRRPLDTDVVTVIIPSLVSRRAPARLSEPAPPVTCGNLTDTTVNNKHGVMFMFANGR